MIVWKIKWMMSVRVLVTAGEDDEDEGGRDFSFLISKYRTEIIVVMNNIVNTISNKSATLSFT